MSETDLPCVYGTAVMKTCPVRVTLMEPSIEKYKKSADPNVESVKLMSEIVASANKMGFLPLSSFCASCPHLHQYNMKQATAK